MRFLEYNENNELKFYFGNNLPDEIRKKSLHIYDFIRNHIYDKPLNSKTSIEMINEYDYLHNFKEKELNNFKEESLIMVITKNYEIYITTNYYLRNTLIHLKFDRSNIDYTIFEGEFNYILSKKDLKMESSLFDNIHIADYNNLIHNCKEDNLNIYKYENGEINCLKRNYNTIDKVEKSLASLYHIEKDKFEKEVNDNYLDFYDL